VLVEALAAWPDLDVEQRTTLTDAVHYLIRTDDRRMGSRRPPRPLYVSPSRDPESRHATGGASEGVVNHFDPMSAVPGTPLPTVPVTKSEVSSLELVNSRPIA
jgi:hypothetical protein